MTVYICIIYKFRIFDIGEAERLKTKQLMMILISKQISHSLHPGCPVSDCRRVWPGWAGLEVLSQFLSQFPQICKISCPMGATDWPVIERRRLTNPLLPWCLVSHWWPLTCADHWLPLSSWHPIDQHWPPLTCAPGYWPLLSTDHWPVVSSVPGDWSLLFAAPSPLWCHPFGSPSPSLWCK